MRSPPSLLLETALVVALACPACKKGQECALPGPCEGPQGVVLVVFRAGTSATDVANVNATVRGAQLWFDANGLSEDLRVADACAALDALRADSHVAAASPELYVHVDPTLSDAAPPAECDAGASGDR